VSELSAASFSLSPLSTAAIEESERVHGALADDLRRLVDVAIRTEVDEERVARARALVREAELLLGEEASTGPAGIHFNAEGRSWNWGNAVVGVRNAVAPPVRLQWDDDGAVSSAFDLGVAYEGPPGCVHGGVSALLLDHLMGETASDRHTRMTVTGTLTLRYEQPLPLGRVRMEARITDVEGRKIVVIAHIGSVRDGVEAAPAVTAHGLFIVPRWAQENPVAADIGSLD
jgi:acyl-coenzyme A thioesterase PaaI-like protein